MDLRAEQDVAGAARAVDDLGHRDAVAAKGVLGLLLFEALFIYLQVVFLNLEGTKNLKHVPKSTNVKVCDATMLN